MVTVDVLSSVRVGEVAAGSQESAVSYTVIFPSALRSRAFCPSSWTCWCREEGSFERWDLLMRRRTPI